MISNIEDSSDKLFDFSFARHHRMIQSEMAMERDAEKVTSDGSKYYSLWM